MKRLDGWFEKLEKTIRAAAHKHFQYGDHDCCLFAADCIEAMTGVDVAADFRDAYRSRFGAARRLVVYSGGGVLKLADRIAILHSMPIITREDATDGDVALVEWPEGPGLGVFFKGFVACPQAHGIIYVPRARAVKCWRP